jgi:hypothetical protein
MPSFIKLRGLPNTHLPACAKTSDVKIALTLIAGWFIRS